MNLVWCTCGKLVRFAGEDRCEDCFADAQQRLHISRFGSNRRNVKTTVKSNREDCDVPISAEDRPAR
jgi:hypothetical protein